MAIFIIIPCNPIFDVWLFGQSNASGFTTHSRIFACREDITMALRPSNFLALRNPNDKGHLLLFQIIRYRHGYRAIDRANNEIHILSHDQFLGHAQTNIYLPLVIASGIFNLRPQNTFLIDFTQGQFKAVESIFAKTAAGPV